MAQRNKSRFWRKCRIAFRRFRITLWCVILVILGSLLYVNKIGLPGFVKRPLQEKLRARGVDVEFTRLRWRWGHGIVAENLQFGRAGEAPSPRLFVKEAQLHIDPRELARFHVQVDALILREGNFNWGLSGTNEPVQELSISNIATELRLLPGDRWELNNFQAVFAGAQIQLGGVVTNASAVRTWKFFRRSRQAAPGALERRLRQLARVLGQIQFSVPPELNLDVRGDARDLQSFTMRLNLNTPGADTPWGTVQNAFLVAALLPASSNVLSHGELKLEATSAQTLWAGATNLVLELNLVSTEPQPNQIAGDLTLSADSLETHWGSASNARVTAQWIHSITNAIPLSGHSEVKAEHVRTLWGSAAELHTSARLLPSDGATVRTEASWAWWTNLAPFALDWEWAARDIQSPKLQVQELSGAGEWRAPLVTLKTLSGALYDGKCDARATLDVATRRFEFAAASDFNPHRVSALLTEKSRKWIAQFSWLKAPRVTAAGSMILPPWTNRQPDWRGEVRPTIALGGHVQVENGAFRGISFTSAATDFVYSNLVWRLPDLVALRPEGKVELEHVANEVNRDYYFKFHSTIDPGALRPLLETNQQRGFDWVGFTEPPVIDAEVWGRWYEHDLIGFRANVALTNFSFRGEWASNVVAAVEYTNRFLKIIEPRLTRGAEHMEAAGVGVDFTEQKVYLTNGTGFADAGMVTRAIGPKIAKHMEPYQFLKPVTARVHGTIPTRAVRDADLHFEVDGGPFEWWKFKIPHISGRVDWVGEHLTLGNLQADFYKGFAVGDAEFDFRRNEGAEFRFDMVATDTDLHSLMSDLSGKTNHLEGRLTTRVSVTSADSRNVHSIQGNGRASLIDGLIWDIPVFGILSPALDSIVPGLGSSRAREAEATFVITNGVVRSDDLEIRASAMRLQYSGDVALDGWVSAHVQAELLRDIWGVGRVVSFALWPVSKIFEYRITGPLHQPKIEPVFFIPRIVLLPFHPFRTLKELVPESPASGSDPNAPGGPPQ